MTAHAPGNRYDVGKVHGIFEIIGISTETYEYNNGHGKWHTRNKLTVRCLSCGAIQSLCNDPVYRCARSRRTTCDVCVPRTQRQKAKRSSVWCLQCGNVPDRRPQVGLCRCGKPFEAEQYGPAEMFRGHSNIADCEIGVGA